MDNMDKMDLVGRPSHRMRALFIVVALVAVVFGYRQYRLSGAPDPAEGDPEGDRAGGE